MPSLSSDLVQHQLPTNTFGQHVIYQAQTGSTNTQLCQLARQGAPEGTLYLADEQLAGRGRLQRTWSAPAGSSLLLSLLFRPGNRVAPHQAQRLTMLCALAMADAVEAQTGLKPAVKWPNDLLWHDGKKLAGILTELDIQNNRLEWAVVGLGLNVNVDFQTIATTGPDEPALAHTATSLSAILGRNTEADRLPLLQKFLVNVEGRYEALKQGRLPHAEWSQRLAGMGRVITVTGPDQTYHGLMSGVDQDGALLLTQPDGTVITILAGDVTLRS